jgi:hypothetical protein
MRLPFPVAVMTRSALHDLHGAGTIGKATNFVGYSLILLLIFAAFRSVQAEVDRVQKRQ